MTKLTRLDCGLLHAGLAMFEAGSESDVTLPVNAWLVERPRDDGAMVIPGHDIDFVNNTPKILGIDD